MPRPTTHPYWIDRVRWWATNYPKIGALEIADALRKPQSLEDAKNAGVIAEPPSSRTVGRYRSELTPDLARPYREFCWPDAMDEGLIPWEASRACLDLVAHLKAQGEPPPEVWVMERFWRITQAAPDLEIQKRFHYAKVLRHFTRSTVLFLTMTPWRSEEHERAHMAAIQEDSIFGHGIKAVLMKGESDGR